VTDGAPIARQDERAAALGTRAPQIASLRRVIGPVRFFALAFGCIVGSGWVVVLTTWLRAAGPLGSVLAFCVGLTVMLAVASCYAELASRLPRAGGDMLYALEAFGPGVSFCVGWLLLLSLAAVASFEGIALPWMLEEIAPKLIGPRLYAISGQPITLDALVIGIVGVALMTTTNYFGARLSTLLQAAGTGVFLVLACLVVLLGLVLGSPRNVAPAFAYTPKGVAWTGILWIFATAPVWLNGFQAVAHAIEERGINVTFKSVASSMYIALGAATAFYCGIILATCMAVSWHDLGDSDIAAVRAMRAIVPGQWAGEMILITAALSVVKTWNGVFLWAARLMLGQARQGFLPTILSRIHPRWRSPYVAVIALGMANLLGVILGRGILIPIVNVASICLAVSLAVTCAATARIRSLAAHKSDVPYTVPGGRWTIGYALVGSSTMGAFALWEPWSKANNSVPVEWKLIGAWIASGLFFWMCLKVSRGRSRRASNSVS
jgi:APA family basic amino acid/polyamine antiporter